MLQNASSELTIIEVTAKSKRKTRKKIKVTDDDDM